MKLLPQVDIYELDSLRLFFYSVWSFDLPDTESGFEKFSKIKAGESVFEMDSPAFLYCIDLDFHGGAGRRERSKNAGLRSNTFISQFAFLYVMISDLKTKKVLTPSANEMRQAIKI